MMIVAFPMQETGGILRDQRPLLLLRRVPVTATARSNQPEEQSSDTPPAGAGVGEGNGVALGAGVKETGGSGLLVPVAMLVTVGRKGSAPVMETKPSRARAWADVVLSPKKRKFGVS